MRALLPVKVKFWWELCEPDYEIVCRHCREVVYGEFRQLQVKIEALKPEALPEWRLCLSCYDLMKVAHGC
jgi:hypothetical protein